MSADESIILYEWISKEFGVEGRVRSVDKLGPELVSLVRPGEGVLDLCCGGGPFSFFLEKQGAKVTAIDFAPYMIQLAHEEASRCRSRIDFILADVLTHDLGLDRFDLAVFLGNTVSDFSPSNFSRLAGKVSRALKPNGRFAIQYIDGLLHFQAESSAGKGIQQEKPERITWRFKEYQAKKGAYVIIYGNESTDEEYEYTSYIYTTPFIRLAMDRWFSMERSIQLSEMSFLDVFMKRDSFSSR
jgi:SAM-dependent methyltransferase